MIINFKTTAWRNILHGDMNMYASPNLPNKRESWDGESGIDVHFHGDKDINPILNIGTIMGGIGSGKSNVFNALRFIRDMVTSPNGIKGIMKKSPWKDIGNQDDLYSWELGFIPIENRNTEFYVKFITTGGNVYSYEIKVNFFLNKIILERLSKYKLSDPDELDHVIFERGYNHSVGPFSYCSVMALHDYHSNEEQNRFFGFTRKFEDITKNDYEDKTFLEYVVRYTKKADDLSEYERDYYVEYLNVQDWFNQMIFADERFIPNCLATSYIYFPNVTSIFNSICDHYGYSLVYKYYKYDQSILSESDIEIINSIYSGESSGEDFIWLPNNGFVSRTTRCGVCEKIRVYGVQTEYTDFIPFQKLSTGIQNIFYYLIMIYTARLANHILIIDDMDSHLSPEIIDGLIQIFKVGMEKARITEKWCNLSQLFASFRSTFPITSYEIRFDSMNYMFNISSKINNFRERWMIMNNIQNIFDFEGPYNRDRILKSYNANKYGGPLEFTIPTEVI